MPAAGRARGLRYRGDGRAGLVSRLAAGLSGAVPRGHGAGLRRCWRFGLRAGRRGCMLQHERPLARAGGAGEAGFMTETTGKTCLPCCCAWMPVQWPLTWRPGHWRAVVPGRPAPWGYGRERGVRLRGGRTARLRPRRARCRSCRRTRILLPSWCAPRRADGIEVIGAAAGLAMAGAGHRPVAAIGELGRPGASTPRDRRRRPRLAAGRRAERRGRRRGLRPAQLRARAGDDLAASGPARPGPLPPARPRQLITCRRSRAPPCPQPPRRRSPRPAAPRAAAP